MKGIVQVLLFLIAMTGLALSLFGIPLLILWLGAMFLGAEGRANKTKQSIATVLMTGERTVSQAVQTRAFSLFHRRNGLAVTQSRVVLLRRGLLGGFKMIDIQWKDLLDVRIEQNILDGLFGSNLVFEHLNRALPSIKIDGLPSELAAEIYAKAQFEEQAWEEKRQVRNIEGLRAASGGTIIHTAPTSNGTSSEAASNGMLDEIQRAKALLDAGVVSDAEFQEMKAKILASTTSYHG